MNSEVRTQIVDNALRVDSLQQILNKQNLYIMNIQDIFSGKDDTFQRFMEPEVCIHLAWRNGFIHNADSHIMDLPGHYIFLKKMMEGGCKHFVVMGSMHEVGYWVGAVDENTPTNPKSLYGIAKNTLRQVCLEMAKEHQVCMQWLRGFYTVSYTHLRAHET